MHLHDTFFFFQVTTLLYCIFVFIPMVLHTSFQDTASSFFVLGFVWHISTQLSFRIMYASEAKPERHNLLRCCIDSLLLLGGSLHQRSNRYCNQESFIFWKCRWGLRQKKERTVSGCEKKKNALWVSDVSCNHNTDPSLFFLHCYTLVILKF